MKKHEFKRFKSKLEFHIFGYTIRITKDRPEWKHRKKPEQKPTMADVVEMSK